MDRVRGNDIPPPWELKVGQKLFDAPGGTVARIVSQDPGAIGALANGHWFWLGPTKEPEEYDSLDDLIEALIDCVQQYFDPAVTEMLLYMEVIEFREDVFYELAALPADDKEAQGVPA
jgi:hypothetical protein